MEEKSQLLALLEDKTNTTLFLMPALEIPDYILKQMGFINAFLQDKDKYYSGKDIRIFALFKPKARAFFEAALKDLDDEGIVLDEYDYTEGNIVLVFKFPEIYRRDYELFLQGKYSKFSPEFKKIFPEKRKDSSDGRSFDYSLHFHIFKKTPGMREFLESELGVEINKSDSNFEYWGLPNTESGGREELNISNYLKYEYEDKI